jgi:carbon-monoxide dehydrogenase small subunit
VKYEIKLTVNGAAHGLEVESHHTLLRVLRQQLGLTGAKVGCEGGECGACTVLLDGDPVFACLVLAVEADGADVATVEGLATSEDLQPLQQIYIDQHGFQCGFCASGFLMSASALLKRNGRPDQDAIRAALTGNLCRCTGYASIVKAVQSASRARR